MSTTRRSFLKSSALLLTGATLLSETAFSKARINEIVSVQLYGVREDMKKDPLGSLTKLFDMGYRNLEHANYVDRKFYGFNALEFKKILDDLGMKMPSGHTVLAPKHWDNKTNDFTDEWKYTIEDAATLGQKFVVSPYMDQNVRTDYTQFMDFMEVFNRCGELCKTYDMLYGYHNHAFEFSEKLEGKTLFDLIMDNTDADKVVVQLDMGNMYQAGAKAIDILKKYPGRFQTIHVKDVMRNSEGKFESTILGDGLVGSKEVLKLSRKSGETNLYVIEQEAYQDKTPMECMEENLIIMKKWGFKA